MLAKKKINVEGKENVLNGILEELNTELEAEEEEKI